MAREGLDSGAVRAGLGGEAAVPGIRGARQRLPIRSVGGTGVTDLPGRRRISEESPGVGVRAGAEPSGAAAAAASGPSPARRHHRRDVARVRGGRDRASAQAHTPARLALSFTARHEAALKLLDFSPALGIQGWAASQLATAAERLARERRRFQQSLRRIRRSLAELTNPET